MRISAKIILLSAILLGGCKGVKKETVVEEPFVSKAPEFNSDSAYEFVNQQCLFGPRTMNSAAHDKCGDYLVGKFREFGAVVSEQTTTQQLYDGTSINTRNIIASYDTANSARILICSHWDSRPWADHDDDDKNHKTPIDGANDGASGVGVMLEMARLIQQKSPGIGVDFVCFDAEDCGVPEWADFDGDSESTWCLGSQYWASQVSAEGYTARFGILLDMVGGPDCLICKEGMSLRFAPSIVDKVWSMAQRAGYGNLFVNNTGGYVTDDHIPVNRVAGIPCIDVIGFDTSGNGTFCKTWHTVDDNISNISKDMLKAVGQSLLEVVYAEAEMQ